MLSVSEETKIDQWVDQNLANLLGEFEAQNLVTNSDEDEENFTYFCLASYYESQ